MGVKESWETVKGDMSGHGIAFFVDFFAAYPAYQDKFSALKGKNADQLKSDGAMKKQADAVMNTIDACVKNINNQAGLATALSGIAGTHPGYGVTSAYFRDAFKAFTGYLAKNGVSTDGWDGAIDTIMTELTSQLKKNGGS